MEIEVGDYVRFKRIDQVRKIENNLIYVDHLCGYKEKELPEFNSNIKELLKVGDIVKYKIKVSITLETKGYIEGITDITDEEHLQSIKDDENYEILEVLTKEQYNSNRFKVKE